MPDRLKMISALATCVLIGTTAAWAGTGRPVVAEAPNASDSSDARDNRENRDNRDNRDEMMHPGAMGHPDMRGGEGRRACVGAGGRVEGRLAYVRAELHITAAQESLWQDYATAVRETARGMAAQCKTWQEDGGSLPDRLDRHVEAMTARLEAMRATNRALRPLYGALDPSQKKAADEILALGMMGSGHWR